MSRHILSGKEQRYRLIVGVDSVLPLPSFYGQAIDLAWESGGKIIDEQTIPGDTPEEGLMVWVGGSVPPLRDIQEVVSALAPYGEVPLALQLQLIEELDAHAPFTISSLGSQLATVCKQTPDACLTIEPEGNERVFLLLGEQGWQMRPWQDVAESPDDLLAQLLFPSQQVRIDPLSAYVSDRSVIFRIHGEGMLLHLPLFSIFVRGAAFCGPIAIANEASGLTAAQVRVIQQEVFFVPGALREQVTRLWYRAWETPAGRGW